MACCSRGVKEMLMAGKCNRFLCTLEPPVAELIQILIRLFAGWKLAGDNEVMKDNKQQMPFA